MATKQQQGKRAPATRRRKPEVIPAESPNGETPVEEEWAGAGDLTPTGYQDQLLPIMKRKVRIRIITNIEATQMALLPDLRTFAELMTKLESTKSELTKQEDRQLRIERMTYLTRVAHMAVVDREAAPIPEACKDCDGLEHLPSLWSAEQTRYLHPTDLAVIAAVAERGYELERVRPFSEDQTPSPTSPPASTGESIPESTS